MKHPVAATLAAIPFASLAACIHRVPGTYGDGQAAGRILGVLTAAGDSLPS